MQRRPVDMRRWRCDMQLTRNARCAKREYSLDQRRNTGRAFQMSEVRLHRSDHQIIATAASRSAVHCTERAQLDRVTERCTGPVCLDELDVSRLQRGLRQCATNHRFLRRTARRRQTG